MAVFCFDLDGTICDLSHRLHFIQSQPADWSSFYAACDLDRPIIEVITLARILSAAGHDILILSGRSDECKDKTIRWLQEEKVPFNFLYMRRQGDFRPDYIVKLELLDRFLEFVGSSGVGASELQIGGVFEDRRQVVDAFRERGLKVFQVADGDY